MRKTHVKRKVARKVGEDARKHRKVARKVGKVAHKHEKVAHKPESRPYKKLPHLFQLNVTIPVRIRPIKKMGTLT